jgi:rhamnosyltransferase
MYLIELNQPVVTIVMATYNGEHFLQEQLDSIVAQTYQNWRLIIRDDGSADGTIEIIERYCSRDSRIILLRNQFGLTGACRNFSFLFTFALRDPATVYLMFCDQDDIWRADKIALSLDALRGLEEIHPGEPAMVYSDLALIDRSSKSISGRLRLKTEVRLRHLLTYNYVYGCTILLNRPLMVKIGVIPADAANHDYWVALVASVCHTCFISQKLINYRRHESNASGNVVDNDSWPSRVRRHFLTPAKEINLFSSLIYTQSIFRDLYSSHVQPAELVAIDDYLEAFKRSRWSVCRAIIRHRLYRNGFIQTLAAFWQVLAYYQLIIKYKEADQ